MPTDAKEKARDSRLKRLYGISAEQYEAMLKEQNGGCAICGSPPKTRALHVDHDHKYKYIKIHAERLLLTREWQASFEYCGGSFGRFGATKTMAIGLVRDALKLLSVRGLLCFSCNGALRKLSDSPERAEAAGAYLRRHQNGLVQC